MTLPTKIQCAITGVTHIVVEENQISAEFQAFASDTLRRLNEGQEVILVIDCEGYNLGCSPHSLGLIQIAECFKSGIPSPGEINVSIELQPGFLIKTPLSPVTHNLLSNILDHKNIHILMYGSNIFLTVFVEEGINININAIIDAQLYYTKKLKSTLDSVQIGTNCREFQKALDVLTAKCFPTLDYSYFVFRFSKTPFSDMMGPELLQLAANDLALIAVSFIGAISITDLETIKSRSSEKTQHIIELIEKYGYLAPVFESNFEFKPPYIDGKVPNIEVALKLYRKCQMIQQNIELYDIFAPSTVKLPLSVIKQGELKALNFLEANFKKSV